MGAFAWARGKKIAPKWRGIRGDFLGARRVRPELPGRDDMWDPVSATGERGRGHRFGRKGKRAAGYFCSWAGNCPRGLFFFLFFFSFFFSGFT
jgi:hypothetical protein